MEGDRRLRLLQNKGQRDEYGAISFKDEEMSKTIWGYRMDRGGREVGTDNTLSGEWQTRFEVRWDPDISEFSNLKDDDGVIWDIKAINEVPGMPVQSKLWIYASRHQSKLELADGGA